MKRLGSSDAMPSIAVPGNKGPTSARRSSCELRAAGRGVPGWPAPSTSTARDPDVQTDRPVLPRWTTSRRQRPGWRPLTLSYSRSQSSPLDASTPWTGGGLWCPPRSTRFQSRAEKTLLPHSPTRASLPKPHSPQGEVTSLGTFLAIRPFAQEYFGDFRHPLALPFTLFLRAMR